MTDQKIMTMQDILNIISSYASTGTNHIQLASLYDTLMNSYPYIKDKKEKEERTKEEKEIEKKILSIISGREEKIRNVTEDTKRLIENITGEFSTGYIYSELCITTKQEKDLVRHALAAMTEKCILERVGRKSGIYRRADKDYEVMELDGTIPDPLNVRLPLNVGDLCHVYEGMTLLVEGEKSRGKSAFGLEFAWLNRDLYKDKVRYMQNGELNKQVLTIRLTLRPQDVYPLKKFTSRIEFITRHRDWWDIVNPSGLNIIDYIEEHEKKYLIPEYIAKIQERLTTGLALIILQKVPGRDYGTGGAEIRNKPSVILSLQKSGSMSKVVVEDVKAYNPDAMQKLFDEVHSPRGLWREYKLVDGWKFLPQGKWRTKDDKKEYDQFRGDEDFPHEH